MPRRLADTTNDEIAYRGTGHLEDLVNEPPALFATEVLPLANSSANLRKPCRSFDPDESVSERVVAGLRAAALQY